MPEKETIFFGAALFSRWQRIVRRIALFPNFYADRREKRTSLFGEKARSTPLPCASNEAPGAAARQSGAGDLACGATSPTHAQRVGTGYAPLSGDEGLQQFLDFLLMHKNPSASWAGSVVMNCNPFTLGHRHLVETALSSSDFLYVFVVEEDASHFPFSDRIALVREGLRQYTNVVVLPSGRYILSAQTFSEYFTKDSITKDAIIDPSLDLNIFACFIAPTLDIRVRYAGDEPNCLLTRQYNQAMSTILPEFGITFTVIDRLAVDGKIVSASTVRNFLAQEKYEDIQRIVPESTFAYLMRARHSNGGLGPHSGTERVDEQAVSMLKKTLLG